MTDSQTALPSWLPALSESEFEGLIFDCDGTLADTMPTHFEAWSSALGEFSRYFPEPDFYALGGVPTGRIIEILNERHGLSLEVDPIVERKEALFLELSRSAIAQPIAPVVGVARRFHAKKPMAVASGGHRHVVLNTLESIGITSLFGAVITAEDYQNGKPSPDPFLEAAKRLGVPPERCIVFEDTEIGRTAANAAGMRCILVPSALERRRP
ncbi:MAG: Fructose-phosphate phosphatase YqaB [Verrucomicrobiota bacterium]|jgi:beta-phosphoglucomutase family hydrolase